MACVGDVDAWAKVLSYLNFEAAMRLRQVARVFHQAAAKATLEIVDYYVFKPNHAQFLHKWLGGADPCTTSLKLLWDDSFASGLGPMPSDLLDNEFGYRLKNLMIINKTDTQLPALHHCTSLQTLTLYYPHLSSLSDEFIGNLTTLTQLNISETLLTALPESIGTLTALVSLELHNNPLTSLPESMGNLTSLVYLDLSCTHLDSLPVFIGDLCSLEQLVLSETRMTSLPESIGKLSALKRLTLSFSPLTVLPRSIGNLSALIHLDVCGTDLASLPESIGNLPVLQQMILNSRIKRLTVRSCTVLIP